MKVTRTEYERQRRELLQLLYQTIAELEPKPTRFPFSLLQGGANQLLDGAVGFVDGRVMPHIERYLERMRKRWEQWRN